MNRPLFHVGSFCLASRGGGPKTWKPVDFRWERLNGGQKTGKLIYEPLKDKNHQVLILDPASKMDTRFLELFTSMMSHRSINLDPKMELILSANKDWLKTGNWHKRSPVGKNMFRKWFREATEKVGVDHSQYGKRFTPHSHRATTCTLVQGAGASEAETRRFTNHRDTRSIQKYVNPVDSRKAELKDAAFDQSQCQALNLLCQAPNHQQPTKMRTFFRWQVFVLVGPSIIALFK